MTVRKLSIALDPEVARKAEASARRHGASLSGWIDEALRARLRIEEGLAAIADWESEHGALSAGELAAADRRLAALAARARRGSKAGTPARRATKRAS
jgi:hypothetical protein